MKNRIIYASLFLAGMISFTACQNKKDKTIAEIKKLEKEAANMDEKKLNELSDLYKEASELVENDSGKAQMLTLSGHTLARNNKFGDAVTVFKSVQKKYPKTPQAGEATFYAAFIYENNLHKNDSAIKYYELLLEKYPENVMSRDVKMNLELIKSEQNNGQHNEPAF